MRLESTAALGFALLLAACAGPGATAEQLKARATFDLECPEPEVQVHDLGARVRGVVGCGRRLSYVEVCETRPDGTHCAWVINAPAWAYGPPADKRPPTPAGTWMYTTPPPQPSAPPSLPQPSSPQPSSPQPGRQPGAAPGATVPPATVPPATVPAPAQPPEPFPTDPGPAPLPPETAVPSPAAGQPPASPGAADPRPPAPR